MLEEVFSEEGADQGVDAQTRPMRSGTIEVKKGAKVATEAPSNTEVLQRTLRVLGPPYSVGEVQQPHNVRFKVLGSETWNLHADFGLRPNVFFLAAKNENGQKDRILS
jgi:hypothetical protein